LEDIRRFEAVSINLELSGNFWKKNKGKRVNNYE